MTELFCLSTPKARALLESAGWAAYRSEHAISMSAALNSAALNDHYASTKQLASQLETPLAQAINSIASAMKHQPPTQGTTSTAAYFGGSNVEPLQQQQQQTSLTDLFVFDFTFSSLLSDSIVYKTEQEPEDKYLKHEQTK